MSTSACVAGISTDMDFFFLLCIPCPGLRSCFLPLSSCGLVTSFSFSVFSEKMENLHVGFWAITFLVNVVNMTKVSHL